MVSYRKKLFVILALAVAALFVFVSCSAPPAVGGQPEDAPAETAESPREPATEPADPENANSVLGAFTAPTVDGGEATQDIFADHELTMVNIWATYCGPCLGEMPDLGALNRDYAEKGFQVVGIPVDVLNSDGTISDQQVDLAKEIAEKTGADYTHLLPSEDLLRAGVASVSSVPTTFFLDRNGNQVGEAYLGARSRSKWEEIVNELLDALPKQGETQPVANTKQEEPERHSALLSAEGAIDPPSFASFQTTDLDGNEVTEKILEGDPAPELTLALIWNPDWQGSAAALKKMQDYVAEGDGTLQAIGFVVGTEGGGLSAAKEMLAEEQIDFLQLVPTKDVESYLLQEEPQVLIISPWGQIGGAPFSAELDVDGWSEQVNDALYALYIGCCG